MEHRICKFGKNRLNSLEIQGAEICDITFTLPVITHCVPFVFLGMSGSKYITLMLHQQHLTINFYMLIS